MIKKVLFVSVVFLLLGITVFLGMTEQPLVDAAAQLEQAQVDVNNREYEQADIFYKTIIQNYPATDDALEAQKRLVILYIKWDKPTQVEAAFEELVAEFSAHPDIASAVCDIADQYYWELEKYEKARELHQYVIENWPDSKVAILSQADIAACNIRLGDAPNAEAAIEKLLAEFSESELIAEAVYNIADEYFSLQQYEKASELCQYVLENWPDSEGAVWLQAGLAISHSGLGDDPNAQVAIDSLLADFNDHLDLPYAMFQVGEKYYTKALQLEHQGLVAQAEDSLRKGIAVCDVIITELPEAYPTTADAYLISADCYRRLGEYEKAIEYYQKVVSNWPDYESVSSAQSSISRCYEKLKESGDLNESEANALIKQAYKSVVEKYPGSPVLRGTSLLLGWLNFKRGQWLEATQYFELSLEKSPEDRKPVHILYALGRAYEEIGQLDKAAKVYEEFINTVPSIDPRVEKVRVRLEKLGITSDN